MSKWYVTIDKQSSYIDEPDECVWTVSRDPNTTGWCTDSGYSGYGLTKADAEELANAANEIERMRAALLEIFDHECRTSDRSFIACTARDALWPRAALEGEKKNDPV
jgi:hypothetical protein